jgi:ADP-dependent NAD(P)H-hydrate dehydratase / NAD(P)H-hydrate epimerase
MSSMRQPLRVTAFNGPWPLHDAAGTRAVELATQTTLPAHRLMSLAGLAVARLALAAHPHARVMQVFAGPGNNGGDALVAARHLHQAGRRVTVSLISGATPLPSDAAQALHDAQTAGVPIHARLDQSTHDLAIDGLLGIGANRPATGALAQAITCMNTQSPAVLAIDVPSGLSADTGSLLGDQAVRAGITLSLLTLKPGLFTALGRGHASEVWFDDLNVVNLVASAEPTAWLNSAPSVRSRAHASHKGSHGDVAVVGGAAGMVGAAWLAARAALAAGAGRVYCSLLDANAPAVDTQAPELMARREWWRSDPQVLRANTVVCGCGGGDAVRGALPALLSHAGRLVLDADALNAVANDAPLRALLRQRTHRGAGTVLTPHPLEAARLLNVSTAQVQQDRLRAAQHLADELHVSVLLKGSGSVIAAPQHLPLINATGNAALATAGTGDVLAGFVAGLWAQQPLAMAQDVASMAAWWHGQAADDWLRAGHCGPLRASNLVEALARLKN